MLCVLIIYIIDFLSVFKAQSWYYLLFGTMNSDLQDFSIPLTSLFRILNLLPSSISSTVKWNNPMVVKRVQDYVLKQMVANS